DESIKKTKIVEIVARLVGTQPIPRHHRHQKQVDEHPADGPADDVALPEIEARFQRYDARGADQEDYEERQFIQSSARPSRRRSYGTRMYFIGSAHDFYPATCTNR